jgi:SAM-dependent methyltransferase
MDAKPDYITQLRRDDAEAKRYYLSGLQSKTEQQKALESSVARLPFQPQRIADIACGAGVTAYHLSQQLPDAEFVLVEKNPNAIALAREVMAGRRALTLAGDIYDLDLADDSFDAVICWQTLSWLDDARAAMRELVRITRPEGVIFASSLFNLDFDVDICSRVIDRTRSSGQAGSSYDYRTYSRVAVEEWLSGLNCSFRIDPFSIGIDLTSPGRGLGTFTSRLADGTRLQISAGVLLSWGILQVVKQPR